MFWIETLINFCIWSRLQFWIKYIFVQPRNFIMILLPDLILRLMIIFWAIVKTIPPSSWLTQFYQFERRGPYIYYCLNSQFLRLLLTYLHFCMTALLEMETPSWIPFLNYMVFHPRPFFFHIFAYHELQNWYSYS